MTRWAFTFSSFALAGWSVAQCPFPTGGLEGQITWHAAYSVEFNPEYRIAEWVNYEVTAAEIQGGRFDRTDDFRPDPSVPGSPTADDYRGSGFDRGHLAPAADMAYDAIAMSESFFMTNMTPQHPSLNRGRWKALETQVRSWAVEKDALCITAGPVIEPDLERLPSGVAVPRYFFKVVYDPSPIPSAIGYLFPNASCPNPLSAYAVPIDRIEELTGLDLLPMVDDGLESRVPTSGW
jgi:endonuclease G